MSRFPRTLRQTLTVARRDFTATVFTPAFLLFLLAPLFMIGFGLVGGLGAQSMSGNVVEKVRMVAIVPADDVALVNEADRQLRDLFPRRGDLAPAPLVIEAPGSDVAAQAHALFGSDRFEAAAVLYGPLDKPQILHVQSAPGEAAYLGQIAEEVLRAKRLGAAGPLSQPTRIVIKRAEASFSGKGQVASVGVFVMFFLTLFLSGQAVGTMAEERSNKVIEILAAAVPLESVFLGKLVGMFGVAVLFVGFWATMLFNAAQFLPNDFAHGVSQLSPAVGPIYPLLFGVYFTTAYMLLGAVFLSIGAQTSTQRELQLLSLPITVFQMLMFGFSLAAASKPDSWVAHAAEIFPFSSPFAMIARAGHAPALWPHLLAVAWQLLWVGIVVTFGARWFRRGVLKSGSPKFKLKSLFAR